MSPPSIDVPCVNIAGQHRPLKAELLRAAGRVVESGQFILGREVEVFERRFAQMCGVRFAVAVRSGTDALILALRVLEIGPGSEVLTVPNSFIATASAIRMVGAKPVFVDVREDYNLDPGQIAAAVRRKTRAILPVHLTGRPADMNPILKEARRHRLFVVEDCAQAVLAGYKGKRVGSFGALGAFSLHPLKTLNACGDGGVVTTSDKALRDKLRLLRNLGLKTREECVVWSGHSRMDTLQAALLLVKMKHLEEWTNRRREHARFYQRELRDVKGIVLPEERPFERPVYHTFVVQADRRDSLKKFLTRRGIETSIHYPVPIHLQPVAAGLGYRAGSFPVAERQAKRILSLPVYPELKASQLAYIVEAIKKFYGA